MLIAGAAGRDFHNFNVVFRDDPSRGRRLHGDADPQHRRPRYPAALAGPHYPDGIPIHAEEELDELIRERRRQVVFAYSDVTHET